VEGNDKFGPPSSGEANYGYFIAICPANCHRTGNAPVYGLNVHP